MDEITLLALLLSLGGPVIAEPSNNASVAPAVIQRACEVRFEQPSVAKPAETQRK